MTLNITPGPTLFTENPDVVWVLIATLLIANIVLLLMNVPMMRVFVKILQVPAWLLLPGVTMVSFVGIYSLSGSYFDLLLMVCFGVLGFVLRKLNIPTVPVSLASSWVATWKLRCDEPWCFPMATGHIYFPHRLP